MKKTILFALLALLGMTQAVAEDYEYVPFVREGVKWVYCINNYYGDDSHLPIGFTYLTLEFKGDTVINGKTYKAMHKYYGQSINWENDTVPIYMREENKVVYGIVPDCKFYWDCRIFLWDDKDSYNLKLSGEEFTLYDFKDPVTFLDTARCDEEFYTPFIHLNTDTIAIGNHLAKRYEFQYDTDFYVVEGIGYDGWSSYTLMLWFTQYTTGSLRYQEAEFYLSHVIEDGKIIYRGMRTKEPEPEDYEYVPFVREGVKWVYCYDSPFNEVGMGMPEGLQYYSFEMLDDVLIGDKYYNPVRLTHYLDKNGIDKEVEDFIPVYLREEDKVVYAIHPDGIWYAQCPVGYGRWVTGGSILTTTNEEFILYNFNDPLALYSGIAEYTWTGIITIGDQKRKCRHYQSMGSDDGSIIEGIGYDGMGGFPLFYFEAFITGLQVFYGLSHVIEDGQIVYTGRWYDPDICVGIDEAVADQSRRPLDPNYYNLMGRPVGTEFPSTPGIYIHQGKKIVVR